MHISVFRNIMHIELQIWWDWSQFAVLMSDVPSTSCANCSVIFGRLSLSCKSEWPWNFVLEVQPLPFYSQLYTVRTIYGYYFTNSCYHQEVCRYVEYGPIMLNFRYLLESAVFAVNILIPLWLVIIFFKFTLSLHCTLFGPFTQKWCEGVEI